MKRTIALVAATAIFAAPGMAFAAPPASGSIGPNATTGQPGVECDEEGAVFPGTQAAHEPGQGSPFQEESVSGSNYAGNKEGINDKNTASVSQYDIACFRGPDRPNGG